MKKSDYAGLEIWFSQGVFMNPYLAEVELAKAFYPTEINCGNR